MQKIIGNIYVHFVASASTILENFIAVIYKQLATFANPIIVAMQL